MSTRRRWTPETILAELEPIVAELGRMPKRDELAARGLSGLTSAMGRHGGVTAFRERLEQPQAEPAAEAAVTREAIAERAYFIALDEPHRDPLEHWLAAE